MPYEKVEVNSKRWFDLTLLPNEEFRDIPNYEGLYQVSNFGRVKSLKFYDGIHKHRATKILKQCLNTNGYYVVNLNNKSCRVHRLVAITFLLNNNNLYCVNHKDGNKLNNNVSNLEFCTSSHNNKEAYRLGLKQGGLKNKLGKNYPKKLHIIGKYDENNNLIDKYYGTGEIKRKLGYSPMCILNCCNNKQKQAYGFIWRYLNE